MGKYRLIAAFLVLGAAPASVDPAAAARGKIRVIQSGKARPGAVFSFSSAELNAYARSQLPHVVPAGVREPKLELRDGGATGSALIDFLKLQYAEDSPPPWLIRKLIEGERPVKVNAHISSSNGKATVFLDKVEISGLGVSGTTLDFLVRTFFMPLYPEAKINEPFELADRVDRIEVRATGALVIMKP